LNDTADLAESHRVFNPVQRWLGSLLHSAGKAVRLFDEGVEGELCIRSKFSLHTAAVPTMPARLPRRDYSPGIRLLFAKRDPEKTLI